MTSESSLSEVWQHINQLDWTTPDFDIKKALVCSIFSRTAYDHIPEFELKGDSRIKFVPCLEYHSKSRRKFSNHVGDVLRKADFSNFFVIEWRYAILLGLRTPKVIIIAIRGTKFAYDWLVNMDVRRHRLAPPSSGIYLHRGFYRAIASSFDELRSKLEDMPPSQTIPIYVTGHSLGGAMAGIVHALWGTSFRAEPRTGILYYSSPRTHSCYTFGMPRFGNFRAMTTFHNPFHVYNPADLVPTLPPRWTGYANCLTEHSVDGTAMENVKQRETLMFLRWVWNLVSRTGIEAHYVERYCQLIRESVQ